MQNEVAESEEKVKIGDGGGGLEKLEGPPDGVPSPLQMSGCATAPNSEKHVAIINLAHSRSHCKVRVALDYIGLCHHIIITHET